jgi:hypothetical protein
MKIALYIEDGLEQIVLTPETDTEKGILGKLHDGQRALTINRGTFYGCRGGWVRHEARGPFASQSDDTSTILVLRPQDQAEAA